MKRFIAPLLLTFSLFGCGGGDTDPPEAVFPVKGIVTLDGKPVSGADVTAFNATKNRTAVGRTNEKGEYQLTTFATNDGAVEGDVVVTITKFAKVEGNSGNEADVDSDEYVPPGVGKTTTKTASPKSELPARYGNQAESGLKGTVTTGENVMNFDLKAK